MAQSMRLTNTHGAMLHDNVSNFEVEPTLPLTAQTNDTKQQSITDERLRHNPSKTVSYKACYSTKSKTLPTPKHVLHTAHTVIKLKLALWLVQMLTSTIASTT